MMSGFVLSLHGCIRDGPAPLLPTHSHEMPLLVLFSPAVLLVWGIEWRNNRKWQSFEYITINHESADLEEG